MVAKAAVTHLSLLLYLVLPDTCTQLRHWVQVLHHRAFLILSFSSSAYYTPDHAELRLRRVTAMFGTQGYIDVMSESGRKRGRDSEGEVDGMSMGLEEHRSVSPSRETLYDAMQSARFANWCCRSDFNAFLFEPRQGRRSSGRPHRPWAPSLMAMPPSYCFLAGRIRPWEVPPALTMTPRWT